MPLEGALNPNNCGVDEGRVPDGTEVGERSSMSCANERSEL